MAFIPIPQSVQLCFDFGQAGQFWQFCFVVKKVAGNPTSTDRDAIATIGKTNFWDGLKTNLSSDVTLRQIRVTDQTVDGGPATIVTWNDAATSGNPAGAINAPVVASLRTAKRGRSYRGRVYVSGYPEASMTSTTIGGSQATNLVSYVTDMMTALSSAGYKLVVASKQHNLVTTNPAETNDVIAVVVDTNLDSQRRRLAGRGT
jgi:hypothetical protein